MLLFEKATFLVIAHAERDTARDPHRFEKISNIIKQFKLSCSKIAAHFEVRRPNNNKWCSISLWTIVVLTCILPAPVSSILPGKRFWQ